MSNVYGIDIGTSNFKMCCSDKDKILNEKNIIAIANKTKPDTTPIQPLPAIPATK